MEEENKTIEGTSSEAATEAVMEESTQERATQEMTAEPATEAAEPEAQAEPAAETPAEPETIAEAPAAEPAQGKGEEKKPLSKGRRILNAVILGVQIAFVVIAITICLVMLFNPKSQEEVSPLGVKLLPVLSGSMDGDQKDSFPKGALVVAKNPKNDGEGLEVGQIVTFKMLEETSGEFILVTHRIVEVKKDYNNNTQYYTKGDANPSRDKGWLRAQDIMAVYSFHINGLGSAISWVRDGYHFIYVVIIPLGLLLIYNVYLVIQIILEAKSKKVAKEAAAKATAEAIGNLSDEELEQLLAARRLQANGQNKDDGDQ